MPGIVKVIRGLFEILVVPVEVFELEALLVFVVVAICVLETDELCVFLELCDCDLEARGLPEEDTVIELKADKV